MLRVHCWPFTAFQAGRKMGLVGRLFETDDLFHTFETDRSNLEKIMACMGTKSRRLRKGSEVLRKLEERLGHRIIPYSSNLHYC